MMQSFSATSARLRNLLTGPDGSGRAGSGQRRGTALQIAALVAATVLGGCAGQAGTGFTAARGGQDGSYSVAGPFVSAPQRAQPDARSCYGTSAGLVDECGPFPRYNGLF